MSRLDPQPQPQYREVEVREPEIVRLEVGDLFPRPKLSPAQLDERERLQRLARDQEKLNEIERKRQALEAEHLRKEQDRLAKLAIERQKREVLEQLRLEQERKQREQIELENDAKLGEFSLKLRDWHQELTSRLGYRQPPEPLPAIKNRALSALIRMTRQPPRGAIFDKAVDNLKQRVTTECSEAFALLDQVKRCLTFSPRMLAQIRMLLAGIHSSICDATVSFEMPKASEELSIKMEKIEEFYAAKWLTKGKSAIIAVHADAKTKSTIIQFIVAGVGPIYITIPAILRPEDRAVASIGALLRQLVPLQKPGDPMAVINGVHQGLNYGEVFVNTRVIRAASGNTEQLDSNYEECMLRDRVSPANTSILNSTPRGKEEHVRIFKGDPKARGWTAWRHEAVRWDASVPADFISTSLEASREGLIAALSHKKNVIVIVAHCDGERIFLPSPPPTGSEVTPDYIQQHRDQIAANRPFVYLFTCEGARSPGLKNFASTLLECGAAGVIAPQTVVGSTQGRTLFGRLLGDQRTPPPLNDFFEAARETRFLDMEVFLA